MELFPSTTMVFARALFEARNSREVQAYADCRRRIAADLMTKSRQMELRRIVWELVDCLSQSEPWKAGLNGGPTSV